MRPEPVDSAKLPHPRFAYSQATRVGNILFVAGQFGVDFHTGEVAQGFEAQARQSFENLRLVLEAAGSSMAQVARTVCWLRNGKDFEALNRLFVEYFPTNPPTRSCPVVSLPRAELMISIEAVAAVE